MKKHELFEKFPTLEKLLMDMPNSLFDSCSLVEYEKDKMLFNFGNVFHYVYLLCRGTIIILNEDAEGIYNRVVFIKDGSIIGEMEALTGEKLLVYSAKTYSKCILVRIPREIFLRWIQIDLNACYLVSQITARKLKDASSEVINIMKGKSIVRFIKQLLAFNSSVIERSRGDLATICGVNIRTINRCVKKLHSEDLISLQKGKIFITDKQRLKLKNSKYLNTIWNSNWSIK